MFRRSGERRVVAQQKKIAAHYKRMDETFEVEIRNIYLYIGRVCNRNMFRQQKIRNYRKKKYNGHNSAGQDSKDCYVKTFDVLTRQEKAAELKQAEGTADVGYDWRAEYQAQQLAEYYAEEDRLMEAEEDRRMEAAFYDDVDESYDYSAERQKRDEVDECWDTYDRNWAPGSANCHNQYAYSDYYSYHDYYYWDMVWEMWHDDVARYYEYPAA